jgi:hypothetical protein
MMAEEKKIVVQIDLDRKPAQQSADAMRRDQKKLNAQLLSDAELAEKAQTAIIERENKRRLDMLLGTGEFRKAEEVKLLTAVQVSEAAKTEAIRRENQRRVAAELSWLEAAKGSTSQALTDVEAKEAARTRIVARENERRINEYVKAATKEAEVAKDTSAKALTDAEVKEQAKSRIVQRENERRIGEVVKAGTVERREQTKLLTAEQLAFEVREREIKKFNDERIKSALAASDAETEGFGKSEVAAAALGKALGSFAVQMVGLQSIQSIGEKIIESFTKARDIVLASVDSLKEYREQVLELAALKDDLGQTTAQVQEQLKFRAQTLQDRRGADEFQKAILGAGESVIDKNGRQGLMSEDEFKKFMVMAGQFQAAEGGSAETHGTLAGLIPQNAGGKRLTAAEAFAKEEQLYSIFKPGVFQNFTSAANQYQKLTPMIQNEVFSDMEGAALMSAFSTSSKEEAGTMTKWFAQATAGNLGRKGMPRIEGSEPIGEYYKSLGLTDQDSVFKIADTVIADMNKAEFEARKRGQNFNALHWLGTKGFANEEQRTALMAYRGATKSGQLQMFMDLAKNGPKGEAAAKIEQFRTRDMAGINRRVSIEEEAAQVNDAAQTEYYDALMRHAYASYRAENPGVVSGTYDEYIKDQKLGGQRRLHGIAAQLLGRELRRVGGGVDQEALDESLNPGIGTFQALGPIEMARRFREVRDIIDMRGGNILPGNYAVPAAVQGLEDSKLPAKAPARPAAPAAGNAPGPQAMFMGFRGALAASLVGDVPMPQAPAQAATGGGLGSAEVEALTAALKRLTEVIERQTQAKATAAPARPTVEPKPAIRR